MSERKGPSASATAYPVGTVMAGNDGAPWRVATTQAGVQRWQRVSKKTAGGDGCGCDGGAAAGGAEGGAAAGGSAGGSAGRGASPRPAAKAATFAAGTRRKGADGHMWVVAEASNGAKRWAPVHKKGRG